MESVIQKLATSTPMVLLGVLKASHELLGNTAWVTYILILAAPAAWIACSMV